MEIGALVWRVGHRSAPLSFVPRRHSSWRHRFDDPRREYRTLYCAANRATALREALADLRPDATTLAELAIVLGEALDQVTHRVTGAWRAQHLLACGQIVTRGELVEAEDLGAREAFKREHASVLADAGLPHLDFSELRSRDRAVTQAYGRYLYERGFAGVVYGSNLDGLPCVALFEGRAALDLAAEPEQLTADLAELVQVCTEFGLEIA